MTILREATQLKLIKVVDTREQIEVAGKNGRERFVGIPGTGHMNECPICSKIHEIHAYVEYPDGTQSIMGTGCAVKVDPSITVQMKKVELLMKLEVIKKMIPDSFEIVEANFPSQYKGQKAYVVEFNGVYDQRKGLWISAPDYYTAWDYLPMQMAHGPFLAYARGSGLMQFKEYAKARRAWIRSAQKIALIPS